MNYLRLSEAARLLGVSDDTVRRWAESGRLPSSTDASGRRVVSGPDLAAFAAAHAESPTPGPTGPKSSPALTDGALAYAGKTLKTSSGRRKGGLYR